MVAPRWLSLFAVAAVAASLVRAAEANGGHLCVRQSESHEQDLGKLRAHAEAEERGHDVQGSEPVYEIEDEAEAVRRATAAFLQTREKGDDDWSEDKAQCTCKQYDCVCSKKCACNIANPLTASAKTSRRRLLSREQYDMAPSSQLLMKAKAQQKALHEGSVGAPPGPENSLPATARFVESGATAESTDKKAMEPMGSAMKPKDPVQLDDPNLEKTPVEKHLLQKVGAGVANTYTGIEPQNVDRFAKLAASEGAAGEDFGHVVAQPNVFACQCDFDAADIGAATKPFDKVSSGSGSGDSGLDCDCKPETCQCKRHCDCKMA